VLRDLQKAGTRNPEVRCRPGLVLLKRGNPEEALHSLEAASKLDPKLSFVWSITKQRVTGTA